MRTKNSDRLMKLCQGAILAALYTALTFAVPILSFGMMQLRFSEALTVLPILYPPAAAGLTVGCAVSNLLGFFLGVNPIGLIDAVVGSAATLLAGLLGAAVGKALPRRRHLRLLLGLLFPVVCNALIVGAELTALFLESFWINAAWVALGELAVCYVLGYPLGLLLQKNDLYRRVFHLPPQQN